VRTDATVLRFRKAYFERLKSPRSAAATATGVSKWARRVLQKRRLFAAYVRQRTDRPAAEAQIHGAMPPPFSKAALCSNARHRHHRVVGRQP